MNTTLVVRYSILILCILSISIGQIFFKLSANSLKASNSWVALAFEPSFIIALMMYGITTLGWIWCLQEIPLSRAYLFMALAFVFVPVMGSIFFGEALNLRFFLSAALIISGIVFAVV